MGTFGERLQREREMRGITLEEIAEATKIGTRSLRALEEQDFDKLPGGIFNKGFVRAYSKYLGIDEDQAVADYQTAIDEAQSSGKLTRQEYAPPMINEQGTEKPEPVHIPWGLLIMVALVVAVGFAARSYYAQHGWAKLKRQPTPSKSVAIPAQAPASVAQQPSAVPAGRIPPSAVPVRKDPVVQTAQTLKPETGQGRIASDRTTALATTAGFEVKVRAKEDAWIEITADGKRVAEELMKANTDRVVRAERVVVLMTGNAGGIEVLRNDQLLPPLGDLGIKKTVTITAQEIR